MKTKFIASTGKKEIAYFIDANTGYALGSDGQIIKTMNAGNTWVQLANGTTNNLHSVYYIDVNTCYAVGNAGKITEL